MKNILFLASPGAGKGTQSQILAEKFNLVHLSSGDLLRLEVGNGSALGEKIKAIQLSGGLVSDEIIIEMIKNQLDNKVNAAGFIFDGFPRTAKQALALDEMLTQKNCPLNLVLVLEITEKEMMERLLKRAEIEGRHDDNEETIKARNAVYYEQTEPLIAYYNQQNKTKRINGSREVSVIAEEIEKIVENL
jgi:adenylate kinase